MQREDRKREAWQLDQWSDAIQWYLGWLKACEEAGADHRSLPERLRAAVHSAGSRRDRGGAWHSGRSSATGLGLLGMACLPAMSAK